MTITGFLGMFGHDCEPPVSGIEVPIFQRDYAQGRQEEPIQEIREAFVSALCGALLPDAKPLGLDFVYGEISSDTGALVPLDGQQRLTTLFLLHWYVAHRSGKLDPGQPWTRFTYRTRPSAELFCRRLVERFAEQPTIEGEALSPWIQEQNWFLHQWQFDPTIQGMLVVIDTIAATCRRLEVDFPTAWQRLSAPEPAVWFHYRPIDDMGDETDLYIKMNSRGKPLTRWETTKAHFEDTISWTDPQCRHEFALGFDRTWSDVLWALRTPGEPRDAMDDRFLRYFRFLTDICDWSAETPGKEDREPRGSLSQRISGLYGPRQAKNLDFLFASFDVWRTHSPIDTFEQLYRSGGPSENSGEDGRLLLFFDPTSLFAECCDHYGTDRFTIPQILILYATLVHITEPDGPTSDFPARARTLRNLIQATSIQRKDLSRLIPEVRRLVRTGELSKESAFNRVQVMQEMAKREFLDAHPDDPVLAAALRELEDHRLLRGSLAAFDLTGDPAVFMTRSRTFAQVFTNDADRLVISGALLTQGDYGWDRSRIHRQYGSGDAADGPWQELLTNNDQQDRLTKTRAVLMEYLDNAARSGAPGQYGGSATKQWISAREQGPFDWRYYFVKYPAMRSNTSGVFHLPDDRDRHRLVGRRLRPGQTHQASRQRDPYLVAVLSELPEGQGTIVDKQSVWWVDMYLYVKGNESIRLMNRTKSFLISMPARVWPALEKHLKELPSEVDISEPWFLAADGARESAERPAETVTVRIFIPRNPTDPRADGVDRVKIGAQLAKAMAAAASEVDG